VADDATRDEQEAVRVAAVAALCRLERGADLEGVLSTALSSDDAATRQIVREELRAELLRPGVDPGSPEAARNLARLIARLADDDDRPHAALALADVVERHGARMASQAAVLLGHLHDRRPRLPPATVGLS